MERTRKVFQLHPKETCQGEDICTTDRVNGVCARRGVTLEQYCKPDGCKLYYTKRNTTPLEFRGFLEAVFLWRARREAKLGMQESLMSYWAEKAYLVGSAVLSRVEQEMSYSDSDGKDSKETDFQIKGKGDSGAFAAIYEHMQQSRLRPKE